MLIKAIEEALKRTTNKELYKVMEYAVFPAGKLFRPRLVEALTLDLSGVLTENHLHLASSIELHHAYTLVHDDLPSMDNDLTRRGKPSTHAHFGEWKAILAGDALLISSFEELARINHSNFKKILHLLTWCTGAKGLIEGQFRDLSHEVKMSFKDVVRIHELKTGRLIQLATLGTYLLTDNQKVRSQVEFFRLGREIGVSFQLLDDLSDLTSEDVSPHEKSINPFLNFKTEALDELKSSHQKILGILSKHDLKHTESMLQNYFKKSQTQLLSSFSQLQINMGGDLNSLKAWLTSFV